MDPVLYPAEARPCGGPACPDLLYSPRCEGAALRQPGDHYPQGMKSASLTVCTFPDKTDSAAQAESDSLFLWTPCPSS